MKIIIRRSTVQITEGTETRIILKDSPNYWKAISESLEKYLKSSPVKPDLRASYDELENSICIQGMKNIGAMSNEIFNRYYYE